MILILDSDILLTKKECHLLQEHGFGYLIQHRKIQATKLCKGEYIMSELLDLLQRYCKNYHEEYLSISGFESGECKLYYRDITL